MIDPKYDRDGYNREWGRIAGLKEAAGAIQARLDDGRKGAAARAIKEIKRRVSMLENTTKPLTNQVNPPTEK